jgi:photosystem II stability/assembly factor-like uncharacterized protein
MRRWKYALVALCTLGLVAALVVPAVSGRSRVVDPDQGDSGSIPEGKYLQMREAQIAKYRGLPWHTTYNARERALNHFRSQRRALTATVPNSVVTTPTWSELGPAPIPVGEPNSGPDSGRVTAIVVDPTDANTAYVGAAQGGVWRTTDGGAHWTALMDNAQSLAIGALALDPNDHTTLWVGTGEPSFSLDSFFGVGLYRILSANATPTVQGPFDSRVAGLSTTAGNGHAFLGESISKIVIDPANSDRMWVGTSYGYSGMSGDYGATIADPGLYFSSNATNTTPTFSQSANVGTKQVTDIALQPGSSDTLLIGVISANDYSGDGIYQTTNASTITDPSTQDFSFTKTKDLSGANSDVPGVVHFAYSVSSPTTVFAAYNKSGGVLIKSTDGGATWPTTLGNANGFCDGQCWYDMPVAVDPTNPDVLLLGGNYHYDVTSGYAIFQSLNATAITPTFTNRDSTLHPDTHAIAFSSNGGTVYTGNDGGVWKSTDHGTTWSNENTSGLGITQFQSISTHPTDANLLIGGTQDNGTEEHTTAPAWMQSDGGDGGFALIDQSSTSTTTDTMYHTFFNASNPGGSIGFGRSGNGGQTWGAYLGCGSGFTANGIDCNDGTLFYAPMALGPGIGTNGTDSLYFGTTKLYESTNRGTTMSAVSQDFGTPISSIGIAPTNDNVRIVGLANGAVFVTSTGADPVEVTEPWDMFYVARTVIDPTDANIAYVTLDGYFGNSDAHVWRTTDLSDGAASVWSPVGSGIPDVPVNAFAIDPNDHTHLFAGTDVGVYESTDSGTTWTVYGTGLPNAAVFDLGISSPCTSSEVLRAATHGRGVWSAAISSTAGCGAGDTTPPTASMTSPAKTVTFSKLINLQWTGSDNAGGSGVKDYTVEVSKAPAKGTFGSYKPIPALTNTTSTSTMFAGATGNTYCFKVKAEDNAVPPNVSALSKAKCTEIPVDDRALKVLKGPWSRAKDTHAYAGTLTETGSKGATLEIAKVHAKQIGILWKDCGGCGSFQVIIGTKKYTPIDTKGPIGYFFATAKPFASVKTVTVKVVASSAGQIEIDGLITLVVGPLTFSPGSGPHAVNAGWR